MNFYSAPDEAKGNHLLVPDAQIASAVEVAKQASLDALATSIELWLTDFRQDLAALEVPASILMAEDDPVIPFDDFRQWRLPPSAGLEVARCINGLLLR